MIAILLYCALFVTAWLREQKELSCTLAVVYWVGMTLRVIDVLSRFQLLILKWREQKTICLSSVKRTAPQA